MTRKRKNSAAIPRREPSGLPAALVTRGRSLLMLAAVVFPPRILLFVALFAWYLCAVVDLRLVYRSHDALFLWNVRYFTDFLGQPGSLLVWTDKLMVQLCYWGWPAAIAIAALTWFLLVSTVSLMNALGRGRLGGTWVVPGILLVSLYGSYLFPTSALVGLALAIGAANLWCRMPVCRSWLRVVLFVLVSLVLYYVAGSAYYCFAACAAIHEGVTRRQRLSAVLFLLAAVGVKFGLDAVLARFNLATHNLHVYSLAKQELGALDWRETVLYVYFPVGALLAAFWQPVRALAGALWRRTEKSEAGERPPGRASGRPETADPDHGMPRKAVMLWIRWALGTVLALSLAATAAFCSFDRVHKTLREIDYCAEHQQWDSVLAKVQTLPPAAHSRVVAHDVTRALYHTGRLPYYVLSLPQGFQPLLTTGEVMPDTTLLCKPFGLLLELGRINEAERLAMEMFEARPSGAALKHLALVKLVKRQPAAASVFLKALRDDMIWGHWAEDCLRRLADDPNLADDEEIRRLRGLMIVEDDLRLTIISDSRQTVVNRNALLLSLLKRNNRNRMAFEYLMAMLLLNDDVQGVVELSRFLDEFSYRETPPLFEQAVLIYLSGHPEEAVMVGDSVSFRGRSISRATMDKFRRFQAITAPCGGPNEKAESAVARELSDTYFYYFFYSSRKRS